MCVLFAEHPPHPQIRVCLCARKMNCILPWTLFIGCAPSTSTDTEWREYAIRVVPRKLDCMYRWRRSILIAQQHLTPPWPFVGFFRLCLKGGSCSDHGWIVSPRLPSSGAARRARARVLHRVAHVVPSPWARWTRCRTRTHVAPEISRALLLCPFFLARKD